MKMIIYDLECPQCKKRANLDVIEMGFKKDENGSELQVLSLFCQCTYCDKYSVIDAEIKQWGKIIGYPISEAKAEVENENENFDETALFDEEGSQIEIPAMYNLFGENYAEEIAYAEEEMEPVTAEMYYSPNNNNI